MPHRRRASLARRASQVLLAFALLPALILGLALSAWYEHIDRWQAQTNLVNMTDGAELALRGYLARHRRAVATLAASPVLRVRFDSGTLQPRLRLLRQMYPDFLTTFGASPDGEVLIAEPPLDASGKPNYWRGTSVADRPYFQHAVSAGRAYVSGVFKSRGYGQGMLVGVAAPVFATDGHLLGVVGAALDLGKLEAYLSQLARAGDALALIDPAGNVVAATAALGMPRGQAARASRILRAIMVQPANVVADADDSFWWQQDGLRIVLPDGWQVLSLAPRQLVAQTWLLALGALVVVLVFVALAVRLVLPRASRRLMQPVQALADELSHFDPGSQAEFPESLRYSVRELQPIVDALRTHATLIRTLLVQREQTLAEREHEIEQRTRELRRAVEALGETARTDGLTGLTNYRGWRERAEAIWQEARESGGEIAAICCDIDFFKSYNDTYGHAAGDQALRQVASALQAVLGSRARVLARTGGEEFVALMLPAQRRRAEILAESARLAVTDLAIDHRSSPCGHMTVSVGFSVMVADTSARLDTLLRAADLALYQAKRNGRNQVCELSVSALQKLRAEE